MIKQRKCIGCGQLKPQDSMIRLTRDYISQEVVINQNSKTFGRSAYLCYNSTCIENALKKNKLNKVLKTGMDLKGLLDGQYKG